MYDGGTFVTYGKNIYGFIVFDIKFDTAFHEGYLYIKERFMCVGEKEMNGEH